MKKLKFGDDLNNAYVEIDPSFAVLVFLLQIIYVGGCVAVWINNTSVCDKSK